MAAQHTPVPIAPLISCIRSSRFDEAIELIEAGANVNSVDYDGATILMTAIGRPDVINKLIQLGANVNCPDEHNATALHYAAESGHKETIKLLIDAGANIHAQSVNMHEPLSYALFELPHDLECVKLLIGYGSDINNHAFGTTPLELAVESDLDAYTMDYTSYGMSKQEFDKYYQGVMDDKIMTIKYLLDNGACYDMIIDECGKYSHVDYEHANIVQMIREHVGMPTKGVM